MKLAIILGTRPEIIKMSPIIRACQELGHDYFIIHTGQHYDHLMDAVFFDDLKLEMPRYNLKVGGNEYRKQVGIMIREISKILINENPNVAIVQGDTNSVLAGALAANKVGVKLAHHEAGLRSHDLSMLEEINRITVDHIADYLFTPTTNAYNNLISEGIDPNKIIHTGNTIVDAITHHLALAEHLPILDMLKLKPQNYVVATVHRAENVDKHDTLKNIIEGIDLVANDMKMPVIYPIHPRTQKNIETFGLTVPKTINLLPPLRYLEFLKLEAHAALILTDSGGLQEEACILKVPCVTLRDSTERPETIKAGVNIVAGTDPKSILESAQEMISKEKAWENPFGDGSAAHKILIALENVTSKKGVTTHK